MRNIAASLINQGMEPSAIALALKVHPQTVRAWRRTYLANGISALKSRKPSGRPALLDAAQRRSLTEMLLKTPAECGFDKYLWTQQLIADLILREFGIDYHHDHVGVILAQMGFTHQKPARRARERDEAKIQAWRREVWPALEKKSAAENGVILMGDEVGFMMTPSVKKTWGLIARTPIVPYRNRRQKKVSVLGAVALHPATGNVDLLCDFHPDSYVRGEQAAAFLHRVLAEYPGRTIDLIWDNLQAHKSPIVKEVLANHSRLTLHYLPPYAPDLNAVEGVWSLTKYHRMANHTISELHQLHAEADRHLREVGQDQHLLRSCFKGAGLALSLPRAQ